MNRTEKQTFVEDLNKTFKVSTSVLLINFEGVNVLAQSELRREISKVDSSYQVIKNRLALRAVEDTSLEVLREHFQGPTAIAYTGGDPVALAKALKNFIRSIIPVWPSRPGLLKVRLSRPVMWNVWPRCPLGLS